jgi:adenylate cyclase class 2
MSAKGREIEIKLRMSSARAARSLLLGAGFQVAKPRVFEANTVFDTVGLQMRSTRQLLRLREAGGESKVTYKGPPIVRRHKSREELELDVSAARTMAKIFERLGFQPVFRYEKYRTEYSRPKSNGVATVDETPVGVFIELEGPSRWIDRTARELGFHHSDYITSSYGQLYFDWCEEHRKEPGDMLMKRRRQGS